MFDNDVMGLVRNNSDHLALTECLFTYVDAEETAHTAVPRPLYAGYLYESLYYSSIKDKLIENLGRSEIQQISSQGNWSLSIMVGKATTEDGAPAPEYLLKSLCAKLMQENGGDNMTTEDMDELRDIELIHITKNLQETMRKAV